ncbi:unnamed protein product [Phytophthora fragariaefolia]|uniref:Unnamed protein product n=1 Tax=Phytophthora fragariaefolia TaxID=1490495 RepID=A0A9W6XNG8_9STRA|nr:unnamed protein product [Phytophthora fragariaefolia]
MWLEDRKWLQQDWRRVFSDVSIFAKETSTDFISTDAIPARHWVLANEAISKFASSRMLTEFATVSGKGMITFENVVGGLCRGWLNDSHVAFCLETIAASAGNCYVLSSLMWVCGWPSLPNTSLRETKFIVHPVNIASNHWGVIMIRLSLTGNEKKILRVHVYMYEALISDDYRKEMENVREGQPKNDNGKNLGGKEGLRGFVERCHKASASNVTLCIDPVEWLEPPQQPDATSCGVLVVAQVHNYLTGNEDRQTYNISKKDVKVMRLRMLWIILHYSKEIPISDSEKVEN